MRYFSKKSVLKAYECLSRLSENPSLQGATQKVSAIRHFLALDMFFRTHNRDCDTRNLTDKRAFVTYVGKICSVCEGMYTTNFFHPLKSHAGDYCVGSNFYSAGQVSASLVNSSETFSYPKRGNKPLFLIRNGVLIRNEEYYSNLSAYVENKELYVALIIWILRDVSIPDGDNYEAILVALQDIFTEKLIDFILADKEIFLSCLNKYIQKFDLEACSISAADIDELFVDKEISSKNKGSIKYKYRPYITAIKSKPFLLLAGISGTGKSRIVRELARACWDVDSPEYKEHKPKNFEMVQVKPNWHDSSELIGYVSRINGERFVVGPFLRFMVKAIHDPKHPYFLCLDEMNLAPVEQYFAEFLSVIESRQVDEDGVVVTDPIVDYEQTEAYKNLIDQLFVDNDEERNLYLKEEGGKRLTIPQNLIIVGTVNMDETTFSFSRKVLDRAMTIEMNEVDLYGGLTSRHEQIGKLNFEDLVGDKVEGVDVYKENQEVCNQAIQYLQEINAVLEGTPFKIAYRTRNEFLLYVVNNLPYRKNSQGLEMPQNEVVARALDEITSMKILSRIEGDEEKVKAELLASLKEVVSKMLPENMRDSSVSLAKLDEMEKKLSSGYTSFWS